MPHESSDYVFFWKPHEKNGYMSQWYHSPFAVELEIEGQVEVCEFATAEHWMMVKKALLFGDVAVAREILDTPAGTKNLARVKALGRKVQNFDEKTWAEERFEIVVEGNMHKFKAHPELRERLVGTGSKRLVEASPRDRIWGVGFGAKNALSRRARWGLNLLGSALEEARRALNTGSASVV